ncbi:MAG: signal recognition particle-docking protein FtsY [Candidatus Woesearchaeota archaeon]
MFKFLKSKLKKAINAFSSKVEKEGETRVIESIRVEPVSEKLVEEKLEQTREEVKKEPPKEEPQAEEIIGEKPPEEPIVEKLPTGAKEEEQAPKEEIIEEKTEEPPIEKEEPIKEEPQAEEQPQEEIIEEKKEEQPEEEEQAPKGEEEGPEIIIEDGPFEEPLVEEKKEEELEIGGEEELTEEAEIEGEENPEIIIEEEEEKKEAIEEKQEELPKETKPEEQDPKKGFFAKLKEKFISPDKKEGMLKRIKEKIVTTTISGKKFEKIFWDLELALLENNVALEVVEKIKEDLRKNIVDVQIKRDDLNKIITTSLKKSIEEVLSVEPIDIESLARAKKPYVICFVGVNGSGKTTTIAKMAKWFQNKNLTPVIAAGDTFRAAAIEQIEEHANKIGVKLIKHDYGSDAAAVAFDAIKHAEAKGKDIVLIDTAGRLHSNKDLLDELKKVIRVSKPDLTLFIGESITGNDCVEQAKEFNEAVGINGIILAKADIDEKGGAALSVSYVTKKPIIFIGTGQGYEDLEPFKKEKILSNLGL